MRTVERTGLPASAFRVKRRLIRGTFFSNDIFLIMCNFERRLALAQLSTNDGGFLVLLSYFLPASRMGSVSWPCHFSSVLVLDSHLLLCYASQVVNAPLSLRLLRSHLPLALTRKSRNSFPCHTYENRARKSFPCHTSEKRVCKSFACHTFFKFNAAFQIGTAFCSRPPSVSLLHYLFTSFVSLLPISHRSTLPQNVLQGRN